MHAHTAPTYSSTVEVCQNVNLGILTDPVIKTVSNEELFQQMIPVLFNTALGTDWGPYKDVPIRGTLCVCVCVC